MEYNQYQVGISNSSANVPYNKIEVAPCYTLFKLLYTALNVACMPIYILLEKVKTLLEWADELLSKRLDGLESILLSENGLFLTLG